MMWGFKHVFMFKCGSILLKDLDKFFTYDNIMTVTFDGSLSDSLEGGLKSWTK